MKAIIYWRTTGGKACGHGEPIDARNAEAWVKELNEQHKDIKHWVEYIWQ